MHNIFVIVNMYQNIEKSQWVGVYLVAISIGIPVFTYMLPIICTVWYDNVMKVIWLFGAIRDMSIYELGMFK